jgi:hypothetical protein
MAFGVDYTKASEGTDLLPEGEYEVIIKYAGESATRGGRMYINVTCVIRNDVDQKFKNKYVWYSIWQKKEPTPADLNCGGYSSKQIQNLSKAVKLPDGKKYENIANWCDDLKNRVFKVTIEHEEYKGQTQAKVKWTNETKYPECHHAWKKAEDETLAEDETSSANTPAPGEYVEVSSDNDLPF